VDLGEAIAGGVGTVEARNAAAAAPTSDLLLCCAAAPRSGIQGE
jgi:hypothetical protein